MELPSNPIAITDAATARSATGAYIPNQTLPYSESWNIGVQHMFNSTPWSPLPRQVLRHSPAGPDASEQDQSHWSGQLFANLPAAPSQSVLDALLYITTCPSGGCPNGVVNLKANNSSYVQSYFDAGLPVT